MEHRSDKDIPTGAFFHYLIDFEQHDKQPLVANEPLRGAARVMSTIGDEQDGDGPGYIIKASADGLRIADPVGDPPREAIAKGKCIRAERMATLEIKLLYDKPRWPSPGYSFWIGFTYGLDEHGQEINPPKGAHFDVFGKQGDHEKKMPIGAAGWRIFSGESYEEGVYAFSVEMQPGCMLDNVRVLLTM